MKRHPNRAEREYLLQKHNPEPRLEWVEMCEIPRAVGDTIRFLMIDDVDRPDNLQFSVVQSGLPELNTPSHPKPSGSRGIHQNSWASTLPSLCSACSARPKPGAHASTPAHWNKLDRWIRTEDFRFPFPAPCAKAAISPVRCCWRGGACN
jgi:DNA primase